MRAWALAFSVAVAAFATPAYAVVTFDNANFFLSSPGDSADVEGARISFVSGNTNGFAFPILQPGLVNNGTKNVFAANRVVLGLAEVAPSALGFTLTSFDVGGSFETSPNRWASSITVTGTYVLGGTVDATFSLPADPVLATRTLSPLFSGLASVTFSPNIHAGGAENDYEYTLDNLFLAPTVAAGVPEPTTWALMVGGFGLAGGALRRRRRIAVLA